jgi:hypothetical protein
MKIYNLEHYNNIIFDGFHYQLPDQTVDIIKNLTCDVDVFAPNNGNLALEDKKKMSSNAGFNRKSKVRKSDMFEDWTTAKAFKSTIMEKKEGSDKIITEVRSCLNKISSKNYDTQKEQIIKLINDLSEAKDDICKIFGYFFEVIGNNKFNSEIYANLYKDFCVLYTEITITFDQFIDDYLNNINEIHYVDQNSDYDKYCEYNKSNDKRKAITTFLTNLVKNGVVDKSKAFYLIKYMQGKNREYIEIDSKVNEVDEITENIYLFITLLHSTSKDNDEWTCIVDDVKQFAKFKNKDKKSLSSRAIFKHMDILDAIAK